MERGRYLQLQFGLCIAVKARANEPNIVGIVLADVGFKVFKRSRHVGQCCFFGNAKGSLGLIFIQKLVAKLQCCHVRPPLWRSWMNTDDGKRENASLLLWFSAILEILPVT